MFIPRHETKIDLAHSRTRYDTDLASTHELLNLLRDPTRHDLLTWLGRTSEVVYDHGLRIGADPIVCAWALTIAARANTSAFVFATLTDPPRYWQLDDGPTVTFTKPVSESSVHSGRWMDAVAQAVVARQHDCVRELLPITYDQLSRSSSRSSDPKNDSHRVEQHRSLAQAALNTDYQLGPEYRIHILERLPKKVPPLNRRTAEASCRMADALDRRDAAAFNAALAEKLELDRQIRTAFSGEEYKQNHTALWPLGVIALVALAHDRGMPIEVESDYLPRPWVTGEFFRRRI